LLQSILLAESEAPRFSKFGVCFPLGASGHPTSIPLRFEGERPLGTPTMTIIVAPCARQIGQLRKIERHPDSVQAFLPLKPDATTVTVVAPAGPPPAHPGELVAFIIPPAHGIAYRAGIWHGSFMGLDDEVPVATYIRRLPDGSDTEIVELPFELPVAELCK